MADKKLNEVTKVTDMAYVPVIMADGSIGQIAKADLASVVAGQITSATYSKRGLMNTAGFHVFRPTPTEGSVNDIMLSGLYRINGESLGAPNGNYGLLVVFGYNDSIYSTCSQIFFGANTTSVWVRNLWSSVSVWSEWTKL